MSTKDFVSLVTASTKNYLLMLLEPQVSTDKADSKKEFLNR